MNHNTSNGMKILSANVDYMQVFAIINKDEIKINADVNAKNWLTKEYVIKDLFRVQAIVNVNVINHKIVNAEKS